MPAEVRTFLADHFLRRINIRLPKLTKYTVHFHLSRTEQNMQEMCREHKSKAYNRMESLRGIRHRAAEFREAKEKFLGAHQACEATTLHPIIFRGRRACRTFASPRTEQSNCEDEKCAICALGDASKMKRRKNKLKRWKNLISDFIVDDSDSNVNAAGIPEGPLVELPDDLCCSHTLFGFRHVGHKACIEKMKERISGAPAGTWQDFQQRVAGMGFSTVEISNMWNSGETSYGDIVQAIRKKNGESDDGAYSVGVLCPRCRSTIHRMRHYTDPETGWILEYPNPGHVCKLRCSSKMIAILDVFRRRIRGEKFLMFSESMGFLDLMEGLFRHHDVRTGRYDGDNADSRADVLDEFKRQGGKIQGLLINTRCGATGLNLQVARHVIFPERPPRVSTLNQAIKRVHRIGQTNECCAYIFEAVDTTDECRVERHAENTREDIEYYRAANEISLSTPDVCEKNLRVDGDDDDNDGGGGGGGGGGDDNDSGDMNKPGKREKEKKEDDDVGDSDAMLPPPPPLSTASWIYQWSTSAASCRIISSSSSLENNSMTDAPSRTTTSPRRRRCTMSASSDSKRKAPPPSIESTASCRIISSSSSLESNSMTDAPSRTTTSPRRRRCTMSASSDSKRKAPPPSIESTQSATKRPPKKTCRRDSNDCAVDEVTEQNAQRRTTLRAWNPTNEKNSRTRTGRVRWTREEADNLISGVKKYGRSWRTILDNFEFQNRTNVNLKDKWRNLKKRDPDLVRFEGEK